MRRSRLLVMLMVGALSLGAFSACGGDDDDDDASTEQNNSSDDDSGDDDSSDDAAASDDSGDDDSSDDSVDLDELEQNLDDIDDAAGLFGSEECASAYAAILGATAAAFSGDSEATDEGLSLLREYADEAPDDIADDLETMYEGYTQLMEAFGDGGVPDPDALAALDDEEFTAASERVGQWFESECAVGSDN
jgi:hypothetical protein